MTTKQKTHTGEDMPVIRDVDGGLFRLVRERDALNERIKESLKTSLPKDTLVFYRKKAMSHPASAIVIDPLPKHRPVGQVRVRMIPYSDEDHLELSDIIGVIDG